MNDNIDRLVKLPELGGMYMNDIRSYLSVSISTGSASFQIAISFSWVKEENW